MNPIITFDKKLHLARIRKHIIKLVILELVIVIIGFWNGLFTSDNNTKVILAVVLVLLSVAYSIYIINTTYGKTLNCIEYKNSKYTISYNRYLLKKAFIKVWSSELKVDINKTDPNSGTVVFSSITFKNQNETIKFKVALEELKQILLFCWKNEKFKLTQSEIWDISDISTFKGFEELKILSDIKSYT